MKPIMIKEIHFAYPTSEIATYRGYMSSGCWFITVREQGTQIDRNNVLYACLTKEDCIKALPEIVSESIPFGYWSLVKE